MKNSEDILRDFWDTIKLANIPIKGFPEEERHKGEGSLFKEIMAENLPNLGKETDFHIQEVQKVLKEMNPK